MASRCPLSFRPFLPGLLAALAGCAVVESRPVRNPTSRGIHYFLPRVRLRLAVTARAGEDGGLEDLQLALEETVFEPDPRAFYRLDYRASAFSADEVEISLTPNGLLERISAVTDESSDDLAVRIVESVAEISRAIAAIPGARVAGRRTTVYEATVDPTDRAEVAALNEDLRRYGGLTVRFHPRFPRWLRRAPPWSDAAGRSVGVFFRPLLPYEMEVTSPAKGTTLRRTVLLPNEAPLLSFDVTRAAFVEKQTTLEFENGVLRRFSVKKPSQALALAGVPLEIARALASLPAEILKLRVDYSTKDAELAEARAAWFEAQSALRAARAATRPAASGDPMR